MNKFVQIHQSFKQLITRPYSTTSTKPTKPLSLSSTTTTTTTTTVQKFSRFVHKPSPPRIPKPHHGIETVEAFLESLRRPSLLSLTNKFTEWDQLFSLEPKTHLIKDGTLSVPKERRYLLRCMELFRQGLDPKEFAVGVRKPKKFRGWGPRVQHGKRLRGSPTGRVTI